MGIVEVKDDPMLVMRGRLAAATGYDVNKVTLRAPAGEFALSGNLNDHPSMDNVSRPELDAKLEAVEARMDSRVASMESKMDALLARLDANAQVADVREKTAEGRMVRIEDEIKASRGDMKSLKNTMITTGIGSVIAIVLGVAAFNATLLSNMLASFESGKSTATAVVQATEQMKQTHEKLQAMQEQLDKRASRQELPSKK